MDKFLKISLGSAAVIFSLAICGYFFIYVPKRDQARLDWEKQQKANELQAKQDTQSKVDQARQEAQDNLDQCLSDAEDTYNTGWDSNCKANGLGNSCQLDLSVAKDWELGLQRDKQNCFKQYPLK